MRVGRCRAVRSSNSAPPIGSARDVAALRHGGIDALRGEQELITSSGDRVVAELSADRVTSPSGRRYVLLHLLEVTDLRRAERELADSDRRYRLLAGSLPESSVLIFDHDLRLQLAVGEALPRNGYDPSDLAGQLLSDVVTGQDVRRARRTIPRGAGRPRHGFRIHQPGQWPAIPRPDPAGGRSEWVGGGRAGRQRRRLGRSNSTVQTRTDPPAQQARKLLVRPAVRVDLRRRIAGAVGRRIGREPVGGDRTPGPSRGPDCGAGGA